MGKHSTIRCIRLWTGDDHHSHFEEGWTDHLGSPMAVTRALFKETAPGSTFSWHNAPVRQLVITLKGVLEFEVHGGKTFLLHPGDVLLAEDTTGSGHAWKMIGHDPWCRLYVVLEPGAPVPLTPRKTS